MSWIRCAVFVGLALGVSCGDRPSGQTYPTASTEGTEATLGAGDEIEVRVFYGANEMTRRYRITQSGTIAVPYIGTVDVAGRPQAEVEEEIQTRLADGYLKDPIVSLDVREYNSRKIAVFGQVKTPGTQAYFEGMTILEAISQAGGFNPMAKANSVMVTRTVDGKKVRYTVPVGAIAQNRAQTFAMRPGDAIFVPERLF